MNLIFVIYFAMFHINDKMNFNTN